MTPREIFAAYLRHSAATGLHAPEALVMRQQVFDLFNSVHGDTPIEQLRAFHLTDFVEGHAGWRSGSTRRSRSDCIRAAFNWALHQERIARNPFIGVRYSETERRPEMPDGVLGRIVQHASKPVEHALWFLRLTGARVGELCAANWPDVDFSAAVWTIHRHKSKRYTGRVKVVALVEEAIELLDHVRKYQGDDEGPLFLNSRGTRWTRRTLGQNLTRIKKRHRIVTPASLHGIRHRVASAAIGNGAPIKLVSEQMGHSSCSVTERFYYHPSAAYLDSMRDAMRSALPNRGES